MNTYILAGIFSVFIVVVYLWQKRLKEKREAAKADYDAWYASLTPAQQAAEQARLAAELAAYDKEHEVK